MLEYHRTAVSEGIDFSRINDSREGSICHYFYILEVKFKFQAIVCDACHDLMQKAMSFNNVAIAYVKEIDYIIHFLYISEDEALNLLRNADLTEKCRTL